MRHKEYDWSITPQYVPVIPQDLEEELQLRVLYILETKLAPPIKGVVTEGKLKWRGLPSRKRHYQFLHNKDVFDLYIKDTGYIRCTYIGSAVEPCPDNTWPTITQRNREFPLAFDLEEEIAFRFWVDKRKVMKFGISNKHKGVYTCSGGIMNQITKK